VENIELETLNACRNTSVLSVAVKQLKFRQEEVC